MWIAYIPGVAARQATSGSTESDTPGGRERALPDLAKQDLMIIYSDSAEIPVDYNNEDLEDISEIIEINIGEYYPNFFTHVQRYFLAYEARVAEQTGRPVVDPPDSMHSVDHLYAYLVTPGERLREKKKHCIPVKVGPQDHLYVFNASRLAAGWEHNDFEEINTLAGRMLQGSTFSSSLSSSMMRNYPSVGIRWDLLALFLTEATRRNEGRAEPSHGRLRAGPLVPTLQDATTISMLPPTNLLNVTASSVYVYTHETTPQDLLGREHMGPDGTLIVDQTQSQCISIGAKASLRTPIFYAGRALCKKAVGGGSALARPKITLFGGGPRTVFTIYDDFSSSTNVALIVNSDKGPDQEPLHVTREIDFVDGRVVQYYY